MPSQEKQPEIETFVWRGQTRYRCPLNWESGAKCMYDTENLEALRAHMVQGNHQRAVINDPNAAVPPASALTHSAPSIPDEGRVAAELRNTKFAFEKDPKDQAEE